MISIKDNIVDGGPYPCDVPDESVGPFLHNIMKNVPPNQRSQIDATTGEALSNAEFLKMCESVAVGLTSFGVKRGDMVVLLGENTHRISAAAIACFFIAAPFGPLGCTLKSFELKTVFQHYKPKVILCNNEQVNDVLVAVNSLALDASIIILNGDNTNPPQYSRVYNFQSIIGTVKGDFVPTAAEDNRTEISLVMPSSGSTGLPKGVAFNHRVIVSVLARGVDHYSKEPAELNVSFLQFSHLYWLSGFFVLLISCFGAERIILSDESDAKLLRAIKMYKPKCLILAPPMVSTMLKHPDFKSEDMVSLKALIMGGAPLTEHVRDELKISDIVTGATLTIGQKGEICVKNQNMFLYYLGYPEETKAAFDSDGWFHTGDVGHLDENGFLYIEGRIKQMIKYRNHQISPEEIENCLTSMPGVRDCGVTGIPNEQDQFHPMALIVKESGAIITELEVQKHIEVNMSESNQLRGGVKFVEAIPRTHPGKVRRAELQKLALSLVS